MFCNPVEGLFKMNQLARAYTCLLAVAMFRTGLGAPECVSHATLKCINDASTFWPRCDPSQTKSDNFPTSHGRTPSDYGHFCTQQWADALNEMLAQSVVSKCGDRDAQIKLLAQIAVETGYFTTLFQPADGGAGLVHMIPGNWPTNAQDMEELFGGNFVQRQAAAGADFFQTPSDGWLSVAAWYKLTNRVIPGCGKNLFDEPFTVQTQCILSRPNDRSEAFNIVSQCFGTAPSTTRRSDGSCSGDPCSDTSLCRSKFGHCGSSSDHCNSESTWKAEGCGSVSTATMTSTVAARTTATEPRLTTTTTTTSVQTSATATTTVSGNDGACTGTPCPDAALCRSKWGFCGSNVHYCNAQSTWKASGCKRSRQGGCSGAPCSGMGLCRSKWGWCGASPQHCNEESTWKAAGCAQIQFAAMSLNGTNLSVVNNSSVSLSGASRNADSVEASFIMIIIAALTCSSFRVVQ